MGSLDFKREELLKIRSVIEVMKKDGIDYETFRTFGDLIIPKDDMGVPLIEKKLMKVVWVEKFYLFIQMVILF